MSLLKSRLVGFALLGLGGTTGGLNGQNLPWFEGGVANESYRNLVEQVFPWQQSHEGLLLRIEARLIPSFDAESQIVIEVKEDQATIQLLKAPQALSRLSEDARSAAPATVLKVTASLNRIETEQLLQSFWAALAASPRDLKDHLGMLTLDGTLYEIRVTSTIMAVTYVIRDDEASAEASSGQNPLVRWLNDQRLNVQQKR